MSTDADHRFDLAISLNDLETALSLVRESPEAGSQPKWKVVGDKALEAWQLDLAKEAYEKAADYPALLLLYTSISDRSGLEKLAVATKEKGLNNIAFAAYLQLGDSDACVDLLANTGRLPEAALFARSYAPNKAGEVVGRWKAELEGEGRGKVAEVIANPSEDTGLFEELGSQGESSAQGYQLGAPAAREQDPDAMEGLETAGTEGSGVMVEKPEEDETEQATTNGQESNGAADASPDADGAGEKQGVKDKVKQVLEDKVKEPVESLVDKVKDLAVGELTSVCARLNAGLTEDSDEKTTAPGGGKKKGGKKK